MRGFFSYSVICSNSWNWFTLWLKYRANQKHILFPTILLNFFYHFIPIKSIKPLRCKDNRVRKTLLMRKDNRNEQDLRWPALETVSRVSCYLFWYDNFLILCRQSQGFVIWHNLVGWFKKGNKKSRHVKIIINICQKQSIFNSFREIRQLMMQLCSADLHNALLEKLLICCRDKTTKLEILISI